MTGRTDKDGRLVVRYLSFQEVSESVNHRHLDQKMRVVGVDAKVNNWILQILNGRSFKASRGLYVG